jgi:hypothetical protein
MVAFNRLANAYNTKHENVKHRAGEAFVRKHKSSSGNMLNTDRDAPWRSASAISRKCNEWEEWRKNLAAARMKRQDEYAQGIYREDSPDDTEIEDPNPGPPEDVPKVSKPRGKGTKRKAESDVTEAPPAKRLNTSFEVLEDDIEMTLDDIIAARSVGRDENGENTAWADRVFTPGMLNDVGANEIGANYPQVFTNDGDDEGLYDAD